ncbi:sure-like protein [Jimgerdemannia flammicorona]|uniref:Sure-like protein n=1 Tax=Jimgerdemannia flammicorona TaxID=994334 RepID=A0A433QN30_9FUNG|nr:sure-like protein [Jimgerdemannia flammicorona]
MWLVIDPTKMSATTPIFLDRPLRVLITNDDGPPGEESPFIEQFVEALEAIGWDVSVCIPDSQKSWLSKSFLIKDHVHTSFFHRDTNTISKTRRAASDWTLLSGTPATCVNIGLHHIFKNTQFDLVIAGPNFGSNSSTTYTLSSGTIGAALDAALCSKKSIALSFAFYSSDFKYSAIKNACNMAIDVIVYLWKTNKWPENGLFNVNVPVVEGACPVKMTQIHRNFYGSLFKRVVEGDNEQNGKKILMDGDDAEYEVRTHVETGDHQVSYRFAPDVTSLLDPGNLPEGTDAWAVTD